MELKKYFHDKIISSVISMAIGSILITAFIMTQTFDLQIILTYGFVFIVFAFLFQLIKSTVRKVRKESFKLNKEWGLIVLTSLLTIGFAIIAYYTASLFFRIVASVLLGLGLGTDYCLYRFVYLPKIFTDKRVKREVLYFSWEMWGEELDNGATDEAIANKLVSAQTISNRRFDSNAWGARFSKQSLYNEPVGENITTNSNVDILIDPSVLAQLKATALDIVHAYEKKKDNK